MGNPGLTGTDADVSETTTTTGGTLGESSGFTLGTATGATVGNAGDRATLRLDRRTRVTVSYDVSTAADDIVVEVSTDGQQWRSTAHTVPKGNVTTGGDSVSFATGYQYVRAFAGLDYADSQISAIEVSAKG